GLSAQVSFIGNCDKILEIMRDADALLHTAETEAFGMALIEAMAVGLPVIAPNCEGPAEIIEHQRCGFLVTPKDVNGYVGAIQTLLRNEDWAASPAGAAREGVKPFFGAARMAQEIASVYDGVCRGAVAFSPRRSRPKVRPGPIASCKE